LTRLDFYVIISLSNKGGMDVNEVESIIRNFDKDNKIWESCVKQNLINPSLSVGGMYNYYMSSYIMKQLKGSKVNERVR
jgi:hypothetical protein